MDDKQYYEEYRNLIHTLKEFMWNDHYSAEHNYAFDRARDNLDDRLNELLDICIMAEETVLNEIGEE